MSDGSNGANLETAVQAVDAASRQLIAACQDLDAAGIDTAVRLREDAVRRLCAGLAAASAAGRRAVEPRVRELDDEVRAALEAVREQVRSELARARQSTALRGYAVTSTEPTALDRSS